MLLYRWPDEKGDLYVLIDIEMPDQDWLSSIDRNVLVSVLPPKRTDVDQQPDSFEETLCVPGLFRLAQAKATCSASIHTPVY